MAARERTMRSSQLLSSALLEPERPDKPVWPEVHSAGASRISDAEMARINIASSAALAEWIDLYRADPGTTCNSDRHYCGEQLSPPFAGLDRGRGNRRRRNWRQCLGRAEGDRAGTAAFFFPPFLSPRLPFGVTGQDSSAATTGAWTADGGGPASGGPAVASEGGAGEERVLQRA